MREPIDVSQQGSDENFMSNGYERKAVERVYPCVFAGGGFYIRRTEKDFDVVGSESKQVSRISGDKTIDIEGTDGNRQKESNRSSD